MARMDEGWRCGTGFCATRTQDGGLEVMAVPIVPMVAPDGGGLETTHELTPLHNSVSQHRGPHGHHNPGALWAIRCGMAPMACPQGPRHHPHCTKAAIVSRHFLPPSPFLLPPPPTPPFLPPSRLPDKSRDARIAGHKGTHKGGRLCAARPEQGDGHLMPGPGLSCFPRPFCPRVPTAHSTLGHRDAVGPGDVLRGWMMSPGLGDAL